MIVKDAMVVIHLAKITLLEKSCQFFKQVVIPEAVYREILEGKVRGHEDAVLVEELVKAGRLGVQKVRNRRLLRRAAEFNIRRGEAEALALYWQENANYLASDDDNLRGKRTLLDIRLIGTPAIILRLYQAGVIEKDKFSQSLNELRRIGWFSNVVIDKILMEAK